MTRQKGLCVLCLPAADARRRVKGAVVDAAQCARPARDTANARVTVACEEEVALQMVASHGGGQTRVHVA